MLGRRAGVHASAVLRAWRRVLTLITDELLCTLELYENSNDEIVCKVTQLVHAAVATGSSVKVQLYGSYRNIYLYIISLVCII